LLQQPEVNTNLDIVAAKEHGHIIRCLVLVLVIVLHILQRSHLEHAGVDAREAPIRLVGQAEHIFGVIHLRQVAGVAPRIVGVREARAKLIHDAS
jgi:hypothetical protein